ncbi:MAG: hypothetical protein PHC75_10880 [Burkholderiales bacterium]|nr:hypothetical protein [Burkholderiales bacterium]
MKPSKLFEGENSSLRKTFNEVCNQDKEIENIIRKKIDTFVFWDLDNDCIGNDLSELITQFGNKRYQKAKKDVFNDLMMSLPSDAENLSTLTPDQALKTIRTFMDKRPFDIIN